MTRPLPQPVRIYRVGGSVRDELLGKPVNDSDYVVVGATPEIMLASGYQPVGKDFPVFLHPQTHDEYALARTERKAGRGYRGFRFFATPDVTLEDDLRRRDLTINAMARAPDGQLIDPYGGEADLHAGVLRHVSDAFADDPLRVLRVARFAARFGFRIADDTLELMRAIARSGELATLASERVWQELARGLREAHPSRMLDALRACGALVALLPEIDALYATPVAAPNGRRDDAGAFTVRALDWAAQRAMPLPARYAVLTQELDRLDDGRFDARIGMKRADAVSERLRAPVECRDCARLAVRWHHAIADAQSLAPAALLDLLVAVDALRRPERLATLASAAAAHVAAQTEGTNNERRRTALLHEALNVVRGVDATTIARDVIARAAAPDASRGEAIASALRSARLAALREWKAARM
ncbi:MAG TPA: multifunctional CCA addition/repair protein [Casimicrobiaceae bacterium]|jgi:tRNA nucleotidyltransferase (CCA-adding enzyme)|nr:multifunctional CCA addition/repair protein [Casimicrobiaceae bacterium]